MFGSGSLSASGGGSVKMTALLSFTVDGIITANGEPSKAVNSGGASGGSIWLMSEMFAGNGVITASGGSGKYLGNSGGGGGGGRLSITFTNTSFSGSLQAFGGTSTTSVGGAGTIYRNDRGQNKTHLLINNHNLGRPASDDITDFAKDGGRTWITPTRGTSLISYTDVEIKGNSHLAVLTRPPKSPIQWDVGGILGDRSGILHVFENQKLKITLEANNKQELLWGVNAYSRADVKLPETLSIDGIKMIISGSVSGAQNITVGNNGKLILR